MKEKPKVPMPGSRLNDPTPGELRGDPGGGDSERKAEPSPPNFTPTVLDTVGSVGKAEQLGRDHGRKKSSRSTLTSLENSGLPSVVVRRLRGLGRGGFFSPPAVRKTPGCVFCQNGCLCIGPSCRGHGKKYI